jgi:Domain of unknown function (DUF4115)
LNEYRTRARPRVRHAIEWCRELDRKGIRAMVALIAIGGPVVLALLFWWMSATTDRRTARSMERYGSALDVLGDVSRRTEAGAPVRIPSPDEIGQPHIEFDPDLAPEDRVDETAVARGDVGATEPLSRMEPPALDAPALGKFQGMPLFDDLSSVPNAREATESGMDPNATAAALGRMVARSRFNREYGVIPGARLTTGTEAKVRLTPPTNGTLRFGVDDVDPLDDVTTTVPAIDFVQPDGRRGSRRRDLRVGPPSGSRRRHQLVAAGIVVVLLIAGALVVTLDHSPTHVANKPGVTTPTTHPSGGATSSTTTTTTIPTVLNPTSTTNLLVTYVVPKSTYTLVFSATAACWLGAQRRTNGKYLWMDTLEAGTSTTYSASGPRLIRLGAPRAVSITLDGIPVALPSGNVESYIIKLELPKTS